MMGTSYRHIYDMSSTAIALFFISDFLRFLLLRYNGYTIAQH